MSHPYIKGTRVWLPDATTGWKPAEITSIEQTPSDGANEESLTLHIEDDAGESLTLTFPLSSVIAAAQDQQLDSRNPPSPEATADSFKDAQTKGLPPLRNPPNMEAEEDLSNLSNLNEPSVLHAISLRYANRSPYTYSGIVLVAINPFAKLPIYEPEYIQQYSGKKKGELEPHLFAIAEEALDCMRRGAGGGGKDQTGAGDQTIVVSGESGAGKTVSAKYILRYFASVEDPTHSPTTPSWPRQRSKLDETGMSETEKQILASNPIMEAFGNAKTTRNDNSSRFGKYIEVNFNKRHEIVGAKIRTYLLERSRLVYQPEIERNYHIFYQLLAGVLDTERKQLHLEAPPSSFAYLSGGGPKSVTISGVDDAHEFRETQKALSTVGLPTDEQKDIWKILAGLLHLGNVKIDQRGTGTRGESFIDSSDQALGFATDLLGINKSDFRKWTMKKKLATRGESIETNLSAAQAMVVRDSVAKYIYSCLFDWLVGKVNESLKGRSAEEKEKFIGVLDIYGFEHFKKNSFEQFCINWANEKLQQEFNAHVFKLEQEEYVREEIKWTFIDFADNQACIDVIEGKLGVLSLLDEESRLPAGADNSFASKLHQTITKPEQKTVFKKPRFNQNAFTIAHYAHDVTYDVDGFIEKNRDTVPDEQLKLLETSDNEFLKGCLAAATKAAIEAVNAKEGTSKRAGSTRKPTLGSIFKNSLSSLMDTINDTNVHYIRCIKPNEAKEAWHFESQQVLSQLRACGVLETIRISCAGYPSRVTYAYFAERYYTLVPSSQWGFTDEGAFAHSILSATINDEDKYQLGLTKIFFRAGMLALLESLRTQRLNFLVTLVQKNVKRMLARRQYLRQRSAAVKIQSWWRGEMGRRLAARVRKEKAAILIQKVARGYVERQRFLSLRNSVVKAQAVVRGYQARVRYREARTEGAALLLQSIWRGVIARRSYRKTVKDVIYIQSCQRRRLAKKELKGLKAEAKSATRYKEISGKLENKVVELTQALQKRTADWKDLLQQVSELKQQVEQWTTKHNDVVAIKEEQEKELLKPTVPVDRFEELLQEKKAAEAQYADACKTLADREAEIARLAGQLEISARDVQERQAAVDNAMARSMEDSASVNALRDEVALLKEQLNRANALQSLTRNARPEPPLSPTQPHMNGGLRTFENGAVDLQGRSPQRRRLRRHSNAGVAHDVLRDSLDERMVQSKTEANGPRPMSMAVVPGNDIRLRDSNGHPISYEDPAEELVRLLEHQEGLDREVLVGLIRDLRIVSPSLNNPPSYAEVMFPAHIISIVTNEMWKFGLIEESERFLANAMQNIQMHVMSFKGEDAIIPGIYWLSNVHEILSFVSAAEADVLAGFAPERGPDSDPYVRPFDWATYERLVTIVKHDLDSLEYNIYLTFMQEVKRKLAKMVIPALIESQALPGFVTNEGNGRLFGRILGGQNAATPAFGMDDILNVLNKVHKALKSYYLEESVVQQVINELLKLIGVTSFNDMLMRRNFCSWKRAMQIQYNITRIEEWCKSHDMQEGTLQLESLMQATKLLQLKKATQADIDILFDVCWILSPTQIQKLISQYHVADYETPISPEILKMVAARVNANDKGDHLLLPPETEEAGPYQLPAPREIENLETYIPKSLNLPLVSRIAMIVA